MRKQALLIILGCFTLLQGRAQPQPADTLALQEFNFIIHLAKNKLFTEAESEKRHFFARQGLDPMYKDSVNYFLGLEYYNEKRLPEARDRFIQVSDQVFFYYRAHYLAGIIDAENNRVDSAIANYSAIEESTNNDLNELRSFELAGLHLLEGRYKLFDSMAQRYEFKNKLLQEELGHLKTYSCVGKNIRRKSPFVAGALSAIIPGLGKVYAGNNGQALASFFTFGTTSFSWFTPPV